MIKNTDKCIDSRGELFLRKTLGEIVYAMGCETPEQAANKLVDIFRELEFGVPVATGDQYEELKNSVNPVRLKNHPVELTVDSIDELYHVILR